jgi:hypothetical protein
MPIMGFLPLNDDRPVFRLRYQFKLGGVLQKSSVFPPEVIVFPIVSRLMAAGLYSNSRGGSVIPILLSSRSTSASTNCAGSANPFTTQVFDLIVHLVRNHDRIVSKDELIETIWEMAGSSPRPCSAAASMAPGARLVTTETTRFSFGRSISKRRWQDRSPQRSSLNCRRLSRSSSPARRREVWTPGIAASAVYGIHGNLPRRDLFRPKLTFSVRLRQIRIRTQCATSLL